MDDDRPEVFRRVQKFLPDPEQIMFTLLIERNLGPDPSVGKEVVPDAVRQSQSFIEMKMSLWQRSTELLQAPPDRPMPRVEQSRVRYRKTEV